MAAEQAELNNTLGLESGQVVLEIGRRDDVDQGLRARIEAIIERKLVGEDHDDVADVVLLWFRVDDGDLTDAPTTVSGSRHAAIIYGWWPVTWAGRAPRPGARR